MSDCQRCTEVPSGETGHPGLAFYVGGPYPGQHIYNCTLCNERWIRRRGVSDGFAWTRYSTQFEVRRPRTESVPARSASH
jgi:hypothetical protein